MRHATKPLDVGSGAVAASFDAGSGAWLSIGAPHLGVGFVELSGMPDFDEGRRGDADATRGWRRELALGSHALLVVEIDGAVPSLVPDVSNSRAPAWSGEGVEVRAWASIDGMAVGQRWRMRSEGRPRSVRVRLAGRLDRPALAEITELDPPSPTGAVSHLTAIGSLATIVAEPLGATAWVRLIGGDARWGVTESSSIAEARWRPGDDAELEILAGIGPPADPTPAPPPTSEHQTDALTGRALAYVRGCTALLVTPHERAILTDHRLLPLSWTRDAYWQALALLAADAPGDRDRVADHLRWLWRRCERPDGLWVRSHHADGRRKDRAFQADQQLYPFIELADHWRTTAAVPDGVAWDRLVPEAWAATMWQLDRETGLIASHETAADDPAEAPFIAAAQVVLWYAAERLAEMAEAVPIGLEAADLRRRAEAVRAAFDTFRSADGGPWAYAVGSDGQRVRYHDANDLPIALAPAWGFCAPDDRGWLATRDFAFSPRNPGWFAGRRSGLGSVHTPGPWPLGDVQAWIVARSVGDRGAADDALARLREAAFEDGMLPEAYPTEGEEPIRHWFAWPGAVLAALRILDTNGRLEPMLRAARR
jgi:uncharacterized protein